MTSVGFRIALWARRMLPLPDFPWLLELRRAQGRDDLTETPLTLLPEPDSESEESDGEDTVRVAFPTYHVSVSARNAFAPRFGARAPEYDLY